MLDVGQGESILIQTPTKNVLIDTSDIDERDKLINQLNRFNIKSLDKLILSHPHVDHIGSAFYLLNSMKVGSLYDNGVISKSRVYKGYIGAAKAHNVPVYHLSSGEVVELDTDVYLYVFYPFPSVIKAVNSGEKMNLNDTSIVAKLVYKDFSILLTGDAEEPVEDELLLNPNLPSTILKAGHHGSKTSSSLDFVSLVNPECVIISAGQQNPNYRGNVYGLPHKQAIRNYLEVGIPPSSIYCTAFNGTIVIDTDGESYSVIVDNKRDWVESYLR